MQTTKYLMNSIAPQTGECFSVFHAVLEMHGGQAWLDGAAFVSFLHIYTTWTWALSRGVPLPCVHPTLLLTFLTPGDVMKAGDFTEVDILRKFCCLLEEIG